MHRVNFDPGCDQGYGSERSPEDEVPPPLPSALLLNGNGDPFNINGGHSQSLLMMPLGHDDRHDYNYDFITKGESYCGCCYYYWNMSFGDSVPEILRILIMKNSFNNRLH